MKSFKVRRINAKLLLVILVLESNRKEGAMSRSLKLEGQLQILGSLGIISKSFHLEENKGVLKA